jgi:hypothetical protein
MYVSLYIYIYVLHIYTYIHTHTYIYRSVSGVMSVTSLQGGGEGGGGGGGVERAWGGDLAAEARVCLEVAKRLMHQ